jgi:hypothetical protein
MGMSLRSTLRKAAGLLVELPPEEELSEETGGASAGSSVDQMWAELEKQTKPEPPAPGPTVTKTVEEIVREGKGPNLDQIQVDAGRVPATEKPDGSVHFAAIYQAAKLPSVLYGAEQILEMLSSLPADLPLDTKRQMVKAAMNSMGKAIGATPEIIVADASRKLAALAAYADNLAKLSAEYTATAERKIAALQAEIEETRQGITAAQAKQTHETQQCAAESDRLDDVLEFFSLDVPPSKYAPQDKTA